MCQVSKVFDDAVIRSKARVLFFDSQPCMYFITSFLGTLGLFYFLSVVAEICLEVDRASGKVRAWGGERCRDWEDIISVQATLKVDGPGAWGTVVSDIDCTCGF